MPSGSGISITAGSAPSMLGPPSKHAINFEAKFFQAYASSILVGEASIDFCQIIVTDF